MIRERYEYRDFNSQPEHWRLVRWLYQRATLSAESPSLLFDLATARLVQRKILLPGVSSLARLVASVRDRAANRLWQILSKIPNPTQRKQLEELLVVKEGERYSPLDRLRHPPNRISAPALVATLNRLLEVRSLGIGTIDVTQIPPNRLKVLARSAGAARSQAISRMPENRRIATMLAFVYILEFTATDDALDLFDWLISSILTKSKSDGEKERLRTLKDLQLTFAAELVALTSQLDLAYHQTASNLPTNAAVRVEQQDGKDTLVVTGLDKLPESASLKALKAQIAGMLPLVDLPEVLLEVNARTGFALEFAHLSQTNARVEDLHISTCAVLLAEACNIGLEPLVRPDIPALTRSRLSWVKQNYIRQETLIRANARLVAAQSGISLAQTWGGGEVASADGIRFTVPVRTINAGPNSKYFGVGRGITYYNFTSDQFTGFHGIVIPGTLRDSLFVLAGLLEQQTNLQPQEIMTDTAGYSDVVFGLFWLLGYQFSPRLADIGEARYWRIEPTADYGALNGIARNQINTALIATHWDDLLRVAGSLKLGTVSAVDLMRSLQKGNTPSSLSKAMSELGRIAKTLYLLPYLDDETYRRRILTQLNRGEGRHSLSRVVLHGQRGEIRQKYREGQEDQLGALGLVVNVIVLWNTCYMDAAVFKLQAANIELKPEDLARLSPLGYRHINMLGRYSFALSELVQRGELRSLREPASEAAFE